MKIVDIAPVVIPGRAERREPGIYSHRRDYGFRAPSLSLGPRNDIG